MREEITTSYEEGTMQEVTLHDGSVVYLRKADENFNPTDRGQSLQKIRESEKKNEILTGLLYIETDAQDVHSILNTTEKPLNTLTEKELCPGNEVLESINESLR